MMLAMNRTRAGCYVHRMSIRLHDVAGRAGVSEATVSRVLNQKPGVAAATRKSVLDAAGTLGYSVAPRAPRLSPLVGVVTAQDGAGATPGLVDGIMTALHRRAHLPVLCSQAHGAPREARATEKLIAIGASGVVYLAGDHTDTTADHGLYRSLSESRVPHVLVGGAAFTPTSPCISADDDSGCRMAVRHLRELGHVRIGFIAISARLVGAQRRAHAFATATAESGASSESAVVGDTPSVLVENSGESVEGAFNAAGSLLEKGCTALVCDTDDIALGVVRMARSRGLSIPGDLSVVVFSDAREAAYGEPGLTSVRQPVTRMSEAAAEMLSMSIEGTPLPAHELLFAPDLIIRESTGAPASR